jgi:hypothetical protein
MAGIPNANSMASGMAWFWKYRLARQRGGSLNMWDKPSNKEILEMVTADMDLCTRAYSVMTTVYAKHRPIAKSMGIGLYLAFSKYDNEQTASEFFGKLVSGANLDQANPVLTLKSKLGSLTNERGILKNSMLKNQVKAAYICIAYIRYKHGQPLTMLRWTEGKDKFPFV